jgi:cyclophilin family peptidyl-prolyl cis-trans isomerase
VVLVLFGTAVLSAQAPSRFVVQLDTTKGPIVVECVREWAPNGADRFYELVTSGYYNDTAIFRIRPKTWAQFGINGDPKVSQAWRPRTFADDPFQPEHGSERGTVFFAWAVPNGRTTQVVINLKDNREVHDKEPFVPFGRVIEGMNVADSLFDGYAEAAGGGIRAGKQDPVFEGGNEYLRKNFPKLDYIKTARVLR